MMIFNPEKSIGSFGHWLAYNIYYTGLTITDFAKMVGVSTVTVYNHLYKRRKPSLTIVRLYCDFFGESNVWMVYDEVLNDWTDS